MDKIINNIYLISAMSTGVILILLLARKLAGKKTGAWWRSIVWFAILIRMLIPFNLSSPLSIYNTYGLSEITRNAVRTLQPVSNDVIETQPLYESEEISESSAGEELAAEKDNADKFAADSILTLNSPAQKNDAIANGFPPKTDWLGISYYIYISGFAASLLYLIIRMVSLSIGLKHFEECKDERIINLLKTAKLNININRQIKILIDKNISVPAITGVFKPKLILPHKAITTMSDENLEYVFMHELTHLKRNDVLKLWFLELVICVHWFNPALYLIKSAIRQDIELSCDEKIIQALDNKNYIDYCNVLMLTSIKKYRPVPGVITANMTGKSGKKLKERLTMINKFDKKKALVYGIVALIASLTIFISCTTSAQDDVSPNSDKLSPKEELEAMKEKYSLKIEYSEIKNNGQKIKYQIHADYEDALFITVFPPYESEDLIMIGKKEIGDLHYVYFFNPYTAKTNYTFMKNLGYDVILPKKEARIAEYEYEETDILRIDPKDEPMDRTAVQLSYPPPDNSLAPHKKEIRYSIKKEANGVAHILVSHPHTEKELIKITDRHVNDYDEIFFYVTFNLQLRQSGQREYLKGYDGGMEYDSVDYASSHFINNNGIWQRVNTFPEPKKPQREVLRIEITNHGNNVDNEALMYNYRYTEGLGAVITLFAPYSNDELYAIVEKEKGDRIDKFYFYFEGVITIRNYRNYPLAINLDYRAAEFAKVDDKWIRLY